MTPNLTDATFLRQTFKDAWRQTRCPRCNVPLVRDLATTPYACPTCGVQP